ncbi:ornithine carbamoyltransferase [Umezawaea sp. Da 62-37]|uniref:ornithine carbamoyltransferase n=1 Tax=Umezawaea sp. Da 62-37 TaxID=3075927 RepID=UPI0028F739FC|nr:ornithine carbamoyltransferase [Umezawaea sp. Da 62-37]WNV87455.1 ornithine carbamoyltransferase [Umezawaea sp. Da 62-37]
MRHPGSLLRELDLDKTRFLALVALAADLKRAKEAGVERKSLTDKNIALVFEKTSTRTRCAFEVAAHDQGAHVTYLDPAGTHMGRDESVPDTAKVLGRMFDGIEFRGFAQETVEQLADNAGVPVWNGLTDSWHPTQMLADVLTMTEHHPGPVERISVCFVGDGHNNVARSLLITGALLGMDVRIAAPRELRPPADVVATARELAKTSGARVLVTEDAEQGVDGVDFVYTDVWVSMGDSPEQWDVRVPLLTPYRVTEALMKATGKPDTKFLHCLPAIHDRTTVIGEHLHERYGLDGAEVTDEVFSSPRSIVFDQAENRLHTIKAVLVTGLAS